MHPGGARRYASLPVCRRSSSSGGCTGAEPARDLFVAEVEDALEVALHEGGVGEAHPGLPDLDPREPSDRDPVQAQPVDDVRVAREDLFTREGLQERSGGRRTIEVMGHGPASLTQGEQRALASFYAGRLPAGQLHAALTRARADALAAVAAREALPEVALPVAEAPVQAVPAPALRAA